MAPGVKSFRGHIGSGIGEVGSEKHPRQISAIEPDPIVDIINVSSPSNRRSGKENSQDNDQVRNMLSESLRDIVIGDEGQPLATSGTHSQLCMLPSPSNLVRNGFNVKPDQAMRPVDTEQSLDYILELDTERFEKKFEGLTNTQKQKLVLKCAEETVESPQSAIHEDSREHLNNTKSGEQPLDLSKFN